jgi:large subunit ribosomal protein L4
MKLIVRNASGTPTKQIDVDESVFGIEPNMPVLHQAFVTGRNNRRWGTAQTKTRGLVQGSTRKIRRQKYTGRARQGSIRAPHHVGGGVVFGPVQRSYAQALPKKMKRLAIRSALSGKVADEQLVVIDKLDFDTPKTKQIISILRSVGIERSALVVTAETDRGILASVRNLRKTKALPAAYLNVVDMLNYHSVLMTEDAVRVAEKLWAVQTLEKPKTPAKAPARKTAPKKKADEPTAEPPVAAEAAAETTAETVVEAAPKPKPKRAPAKPKASTETKAKDAPKAARSRATKATTDAAEKKPAPRKRAPKKTEGEG